MVFPLSFISVSFLCPAGLSGRAALFWAVLSIAAANGKPPRAIDASI